MTAAINKASNIFSAINQNFSYLDNKIDTVVSGIDTSNLANKDLSNITSTGKKTVDNWGCPDYSAGISMGFPVKPLSTTTTTYTCPSAGTVYIWAIQRSNGGVIQTYVNGVEILAGASFGMASNTSATFPVGQSDVITIKTTEATETWEIKTQKFYPLKGEA
jgi:hypothetical protein